MLSTAEQPSGLSVRHGAISQLRVDLEPAGRREEMCQCPLALRDAMHMQLFVSLGSRISVIVITRFVPCCSLEPPGLHLASEAENTGSDNTKFGLCKADHGPLYTALNRYF